MSRGEPEVESRASTHIKVLQVESNVEESEEGVDELEEDKFENQPVLVGSLMLVVLPIVEGHGYVAVQH